MEQNNNKTWKDFIPENTYVYCVDYDSDLRDNADILQECISQNNLYPIYDKIFDWWEFPEEYELDDIKRQMVNAGLEDEFNEHYDDIRDEIFERDKSTPVEDLLSNTGKMQCFYSLSEIEGYTYPQFLSESWRPVSESEDVDNICKFLNITDEYRVGRIEELVYEAYHGGELRIYFDAYIEEFLNKTDKDWTSVTFNGEYNLAIVNTYEGSGGLVTIKLDTTLPFNRSNLFVSKQEKWGMEDVWGIDKSNCDCPDFGYVEVGEIASSSTSQKMEQERKFKEIYRNGGCSYEDNDMRRHRDVEYINEIPCGWKCPHCGRFWVD